MFGFIDEWWQALLLIVAIVAGLVVVGVILIGLIRNVAKSKTTVSVGVGKMGALKLGVAKPSEEIDLSAPTFDYKNWSEVLLRFNQVIHAAFRKGQIMYKELPEALSVPLEKARSAIHRLYENRYMTIFAEECRNIRERGGVIRPDTPDQSGPFDNDGCDFEELDHRALVSARDVRDFKFVLNQATDEILNYIRFLYTEEELIEDERDFNRYCEDEVVAIVGKFDSAIHDRYYDRSLVQPTTMYRKMRECVPQLGRIVETAIRRGRQLTFDKMGELTAIDDELKNYGVELHNA